MDENPAGLGEALLLLARAAIQERLGSAPSAAHSWEPAVAERLARPGATFVTLTQQGRLRGCIGSLEAHRSLIEDVASNAVNAAVRDPRFAHLTRAELGRTDIEVSLLSAAEPVHFTTRDEALAALRPGVDGVILSAGGRRGTFLPQVWEQLPDPEDFLDHLVRKAGLPAGHWSERVRLERYTVTAWREEPR